MPERDPSGLSRLDADRAHSMADEGGASAALVDCPGAALEGWKGATTAVACLIGLAAGVGLVALWRAR